MRITGHFGQRQAVGHVQTSIIHDGDELAATGEKLEESVQILDKSRDDAQAAAPFIGQFGLSCLVKGRILFLELGRHHAALRLGQGTKRQTE